MATPLAAATPSITRIGLPSGKGIAIQFSGRWPSRSIAGAVGQE
jgi:hypothetical protein